jgi:hypothetical protein
MSFITENNLTLHVTIWGCPTATALQKPYKASLQPNSFIQKIGNRIPGWKRNFLTNPRQELFSSVYKY